MREPPPSLITRELHNGVVVTPLTLHRSAAGVAVAAILICVMTLIGWGMGQSWMVRTLSGLASMKPLTGAGLGLAALALLLQSAPRIGATRLVISRFAAGAALAIGVVFIIEYAAGWNSGLRNLVFGSALGVESGRPSLATCSCIAFGGAAALLLRSGRLLLARTAQTAAALNAVIAAVALIGYTTGVENLYSFAPYSTMALQTAVTVMLISVGSVLARPDRGLCRLAFSADEGGRLARYLLPVCIGVPLLIGAAVGGLDRSGVLQSPLDLGLCTIGMIVLSTAAVGGTALRLGRSDRRRREAEQRIDRMISELDHRVKNTMAVVLALCDLSAGSSQTLQQFQSTYRGRIQAMARAHEALAEARWRGVSLRYAVSMAVEPHIPSPVEARATIEGPDTLLPPQASLPLAVTLHELATNALRHGAWAPEHQGRVQLKWSLDDQSMLRMEWTESGAGPAKVPSGHDSISRSFGLSLIRGMIPHELKGQVSLDFTPHGVHCLITVPLTGAAMQAREAAFRRVA